MRFLLAILLLISFLVTSSSQTCCSGGVPLSSNIGFQSSAKGAWQWALSYDNNQLKTLYHEGEVLGINNRERLTRSLLIRAGYGISDRVSVETLIPFVNQKRNITQNSGEINTESSSGAGDVLILFKYDVVRDISTTFNLGLGVKVPIGSTNESNSQGLLLVNDMQPGSGATELVARLSFIHHLNVRPSLSIYLNSVASFKGTDHDYLGSQQYQYGRDFQVMTGISDQILSYSVAIHPGLGLRFRYAHQDNINNNPLQNTGGQWVFTRTSVGIDIYKNHRITFNYEFPVFTRVDGTQLSPDRIFNVTYSSSFSPLPSKRISL